MTPMLQTQYYDYPAAAAAAGLALPPIPLNPSPTLA